MARSKNSLRADGGNLLRGLLMGGADAIPGVSGGTVALILRIYTRLVTAISHFDLALIGHVRRRQWSKVAEHIDLRFLVSLGCGIGLGLVITLRSMGQLLEGDYRVYTRTYTLAALFGMILASCFLVSKMIKARTQRDVLMSITLGAAGAAMAFAVYWFTTFGESPSHATEPGYFYLFCCAAIAICAMILPGISGAMMLLLLGVYVHLSHVPDHLLKGERITESLLTILVFCSGCAVGLIGFSKILRWLLTRFRSRTMAVLCGFMFGALPKLWPFDKEIRVEPSGDARPVYHPTLPEALDGQLLGVVLVVFIAAAFVFLTDRLARRHAHDDLNDA